MTKRVLRSTRQGCNKRKRDRTVVLQVLGVDGRPFPMFSKTTMLFESDANVADCKERVSEYFLQGIIHHTHLTVYENEDKFRAKTPLSERDGLPDTSEDLALYIVAPMLELEYSLVDILGNHFKGTSIFTMTLMMDFSCRKFKDLVYNNHSKILSFCTSFDLSVFEGKEHFKSPKTSDILLNAFGRSTERSPLYVVVPEFERKFYFLLVDYLGNPFKSVSVESSLLSHDAEAEDLRNAAHSRFQVSLPLNFMSTGTRSTSTPALKANLLMNITAFLIRRLVDPS